MELYDLVIQYRRENKLSQREFAKKAGLSNSIVSIIEKGYNPQTGRKTSPTIDTYAKIAKTIGVPIYELLKLIDAFDNE